MFEKVKKAFEERGYTLLSTEYVNARTKLEYKCNKHPEENQFVTWDKFNGRGQGCKKCGRERLKDKLKLPFETVKAAFEEKGYTLLEIEYINNQTPMRYICSKHPEEVQDIVYGSLKQGNGCRYCGKESAVRKLKAEGYTKQREAAKKRRIPFSIIKRQFEERGYTLLTTEEEYQGTESQVNFVCPNHPDKIATVRVDTFRNGAGCNHCAYDAIRGENNWNWNPDLTEEEREANKSRHSLPEYRQWMREVFARDKFTCQKCGQVGYHLEAHHKDGWHWCENRRFDVDNGATLCIDCHLDFHVKYGRKNNTEEQYKEWV